MEKDSLESQTLGVATPQFLGHRGVMIFWCPEYQGVATPQCPRYWGVATLDF